METSPVEKKKDEAMYIETRRYDYTACVIEELQASLESLVKTLMLLPRAKLCNATKGPGASFMTFIIARNRSLSLS